MRKRIDELVVFCSECEHSEFVHVYRDQLCLFSDCDCSGFEVPRSVVLQLDEPDDTVRIWDTGGLGGLQADAL
jgi:hypothetical protein